LRTDGDWAYPIRDAMRTKAASPATRFTEINFSLASGELNDLQIITQFVVAYRPGVLRNLSIKAPIPHPVRKMTATDSISQKLRKNTSTHLTKS
jgi:hypothetical protein